jgi:hypothetical protein
VLVQHRPAAGAARAEPEVHIELELQGIRGTTYTTDAPDVQRSNDRRVLSRLATTAARRGNGELLSPRACTLKVLANIGGR